MAEVPGGNHLETCHGIELLFPDQRQAASTALHGSFNSCATFVSHGGTRLSPNGNRPPVLSGPALSLPHDTSMRRVFEMLIRHADTRQEQNRNGHPYALLHDTSRCVPHAQDMIARMRRGKSGGVRSASSQIPPK